MHYKEYLIETIESEPGRWRFTIRRRDGRKIKTFDGGSYESIPSPHESLTRDQAIEYARKVIDKGGMST
jgi:hypothetical protein